MYWPIQDKVSVRSHRPEPPWTPYEVYTVQCSSNIVPSTTGNDH